MMENLKIAFVGNNINQPAREGDVGHDLVAATEPKFIGDRLGDKFYSLLRYIEYNIEVAIAPPKGVYSLVYPRSSITDNTNLILGNCVGVVDNQYRNFVRVRFRYVPQPRDYRLIDDQIYIEVDDERIYHKGDRVAQLVFSNQLDVELVEAQQLNSTQRGLGGFGHTGR
jgi:dUTP pyrophosphatase